MVYGMAACWLLLGIKGFAVILLHATISFAVAQFQLSLLTWLCSLILLSTLRIPAVEEAKVMWQGLTKHQINYGGVSPLLQLSMEYYPFSWCKQKLAWKSLGSRVAVTHAGASPVRKVIFLNHAARCIDIKVFALMHKWY